MNVNTDLLAHLGFNLREVGKLMTGTAKIPYKQVSKDKPKSGIEGINWCNREKKWIVFLKVDGKRTLMGYVNELDDAIELQTRKRWELERAAV